MKIMKYIIKDVNFQIFCSFELTWSLKIIQSWKTQGKCAESSALPIPNLCSYLISCLSIASQRIFLPGRSSIEPFGVKIVGDLKKTETFCWCPSLKIELVWALVFYFIICIIRRPLAATTGCCSHLALHRGSRGQSGGSLSEKMKPWVIWIRIAHIISRTCWFSICKVLPKSENWSKNNGNNERSDKQMRISTFSADHLRSSLGCLRAPGHFKDNFELTQSLKSPKLEKLNKSESYEGSGAESSTLSISNLCSYLSLAFSIDS